MTYEILTPEDCPHCKVKLVTIDDIRYLRCQDCKAIFGPYEVEPPCYEHG